MLPDASGKSRQYFCHPCKDRQCQFCFFQPQYGRRPWQNSNFAGIKRLYFHNFSGVNIWFIAELYFDRIRFFQDSMNAKVAGKIFNPGYSKQIAYRLRRFAEPVNKLICQFTELLLCPHRNNPLINFHLLHGIINIIAA